MRSVQQQKSNLKVFCIPDNLLYSLARNPTLDQNLILPWDPKTVHMQQLPASLKGYTQKTLLDTQFSAEVFSNFL